MIPFSGYELVGGLAFIFLLASVVPDVFGNRVFFTSSSHEVGRK